MWDSFPEFAQLRTITKFMEKMMNQFILLVVAVTVGVISGLVDENELKRCAKEAVKQDCLDDNGTWMQRVVFRRQCNVSIGFDTAGLCTQDEDTGTYCGETQYYVQDLSHATSTCASAISNTTTDCSPECKSSLQGLRDDLGCCINVFLNNTESPAYPFYQQLFDSTLWGLCDVPLVETCPIKLPDNLEKIVPRTCSDKELVAHPFEVLCASSVVSGIDGCKYLNEYYRDICSFDEDGEYCINKDIVSHFSSYIFPIMRTCNASQECSEECKGLLQQFESDLGCCVNVLYNSTFGYIKSINAQFLETNNLFIQCNVEPPPSNCEVKGLSVSASKSLPIGIFSLLLLLIVTIFF